MSKQSILFIIPILFILSIWMRTWVSLPSSSGWGNPISWRWKQYYRRNFGNKWPSDTASHSTRLESSATLLWEPHTSHFWQTSDLGVLLCHQPNDKRFADCSYLLKELACTWRHSSSRSWILNFIVHVTFFEPCLLVQPCDKNQKMHYFYFNILV